MKLKSRRRTVIRSLWVTLVLCVTAGFAPLAWADNPIVQTVYTADPAPLVHNGRVYLYTGHDEDNSTYFTMKDWRVFSSADMVNWTDHGSPMSVATFSWASKDAWAGHVIHRNGKFYWYVPVTNRATNRMAIGVGVSTSPTGPFTDAIGRPLVENGEIDPSVFIDDDGQAYLYWGNPNLWYVRLNSDMISYSGSPTRIPLTAAGFGARPGNVANRPTLYEEGPWVYKRNGLYYNVFAAECCSEFIAYSTAPTATGPWTYRGTIMPRQGSSFTNHAGVIDFNGGSYFFYHNGALPGGGGFTRSVAVEKFTYNADGTIPTINMTSAGAPQIGTLNPYVRQEAETIAWSAGVETEAASEGGRNVSYIDNGDYIKVKGVAFGSGAASFSARVASAGAGGRIELRLGSTTGALVGACTVPVTGGWQTWTTVTCPVTGASGTQDLYLRFTGGSGSLFNVNWWQFTPRGDGQPTNSLLYSSNFPDRLVRHANSDVRIDANVNPPDDAQWRIVPGLASTTGGNVSFESVNRPGHYMRHSNYDLVLASNDGSTQFKADATFTMVNGLVSGGTSFRSYNFPDRYLRHYNYLLRIDPISTATDRADATFRVIS